MDHEDHYKVVIKNIYKKLDMLIEMVGQWLNHQVDSTRIPSRLLHKDHYEVISFGTEEQKKESPQVALGEKAYEYVTSVRSENSKVKSSLPITIDFHYFSISLSPRDFYIFKLALCNYQVIYKYGFSYCTVETSKNSWWFARHKYLGF